VFEALPEPDPQAPPAEAVVGVSYQPGRRHLTERQAEVVERLLTAAAAEGQANPYADISVRSIATRAGVAAATAYTYFSSKDHLLSEVMWRRLDDSPYVADLDRPLADRVVGAVASMSFGATEDPAVVRAGTIALLGDGPDVLAVRARIGREIAHRLAAALGPDFDAKVLRVLQITYTGAILSAGLGHLEFDALPHLMAEATALLTGGGA
jgi:AcrR family transcriptional regulator